MGVCVCVSTLLNNTELSPVQTPVDTEDVQPAPNIDHLLSNIGRTALLGEASGERLRANQKTGPNKWPIGGSEYLQPTTY